jgi:hypothetical protein
MVSGSFEGEGLQMIEVMMWNSDRPALIDEQFVDLLKYTWRLNHQGYVIRYADKVIKLHHAIIGKIPIGMVIDHVNRDTLDNRLSNLRLIPKAGNAQNRNAHKNNVTGLRGVHFRKDTGKFLAHVRMNGINIRLGYYATANDAYVVASKYRKAHMPYTMN